MKKEKRIIESKYETPVKLKFSDKVIDRLKKIKSFGIKKRAKKKAAKKKR